MRNSGTIPRCQAATRGEMDSEGTRPKMRGALGGASLSPLSPGSKARGQGTAWSCRLDAREDFPRASFARGSFWAPVDTEGVVAGPTQQLLCSLTLILCQPGPGGIPAQPLGRAGHHAGHQHLEHPHLRPEHLPRLGLDQRNPLPGERHRAWPLDRGTIWPRPGRPKPFLLL